MGSNGSSGSTGGSGGQPGAPSVPWPFETTPYTYSREYFDSEDVISALTLPAFNALQGGSFSGKDALKGLVNQIAARNATQMLLPASVNPVTKHSLKCLVAGAMLPVEDYILMSRKGSTESFTRKLARGTFASLVASTVGPAVGDSLPAYT